MTEKKPTLEYGTSDESGSGCAGYLLILALDVGVDRIHKIKFKSLSP